jgi:uroporphyrinogen III methyltransferase/synthase
VAGLERVRNADVIVYDRLVNRRLLEHAKEGAELIDVGKIPGESHDQGAINDLLIEKARQGKRVVRLKGGDPFVFGRGGEEAEALREAGIDFEVVPGVTSAVAVPAYAGIPVTHRGVASSFAVITGHEDPEKEETAINWQHLATAVDTLVFLMGAKTLPEVVRRLMQSGRAAETPAAVIERGTSPEQRTVTGTLGDIVERVRDAGVQPPAITVVGEVVRLREAVSWFAETGGRPPKQRPLFGKRVLITRTRKQASTLARMLADEGAIPIELPSIEIEASADAAEVERAAAALANGEYAWAVFTSANGVEEWFRHLAERGLDARAFGGTKVAAIGPATAEALLERGLRADLVPTEYVAESVVEALRPHLSTVAEPVRAPRGEAGRPGPRVLLPRAEDARQELPDGLRALGAEVDEVTLYRAAVPSAAPAEALELLRRGEIDIVTFTSSSTVRNLVAMLNGSIEALERPGVACIGPITAQTARELGLRVDVEAAEHTVEGLVEALKVMT